MDLEGFRLEVGQRELLLLLGAAITMYLLSSLHLNHLIAVLVVSLWAAVGLYFYGRGMRSSSAPALELKGKETAGGGNDPPLRFLASNVRFVDILTSLAPLKRFDRARFRELGLMLDAFQKQYVYIMSGRASPDVGALKDALLNVLRVAYSLYVVVPRVGKHFYGVDVLWTTLDNAVKGLREVMTAMVEVVVNHAAESGVEIPNQVGAEPASRLFDVDRREPDSSELP